jgi:uncharacterized protein (TIGR03067 family)
MKINTMCAAVAAILIAAAAAQNDTAQEGLKKLEGTYTMVRGEDGGKPLGQEIVRVAKLTITGDRHVVQLGEETIRGTHTVNPLEIPKSIDATDTTGRFAGKTVKGIYKLEDGEFTVCFAPPNEPRPIDFTTKDKPGRLLHVWKRTK